MRRAPMKSLRHLSDPLWIVSRILIFGLVLTFGCSSERQDSVQQNSAQQDSALRGSPVHDGAGNSLDEGKRSSRDRVEVKGPSVMMLSRQLFPSAIWLIRRVPS